MLKVVFNCLLFKLAGCKSVQMAVFGTGLNAATLINVRIRSELGQEH